MCGCFLWGQGEGFVIFISTEKTRWVWGRCRSALLGSSQESDARRPEDGSRVFMPASRVIPTAPAPQWDQISPRAGAVRCFNFCSGSLRSWCSVSTRWEVVGRRARPSIRHGLPDCLSISKLCRCWTNPLIIFGLVTTQLGQTVL